MAALARANEIRLARKLYKARLREAGRIEAQEIVADHIRKPPEWLASARVGEVIRWCPLIGPARAKSLLGMDIRPSTRVANLSKRQRTLLIHRLRQ